MNKKLNPKLLDIAGPASKGSGLPARTGTVVEVLNTGPGSVLIEMTDDEGVLTDLIVAEMQKSEVVWSAPESAPPGEPVPGAEELFEQGLFLLQNGLILKARTTFSEAFRIEPRFAGTLMNLANESATRSAFQVAIFLYRMILDLQPSYRLALENLAITHLNQGVAFARLGVVDKAIEEFNQTLLLQPTGKILQLCSSNLVAAYTALGIQLSAIKRYQEGMQFFFLAFQLQPSEPVARRNLALSLVAAAASEREGRGVPSNESFKQFILMGLTLSECFNAYGATVASLGQLPDARIILRKALDIDPYNTLAKSNLEIVELRAVSTVESHEVPLDLPLGIMPFETYPASVTVLQ